LFEKETNSSAEVTKRPEATVTQVKPLAGIVPAAAVIKEANFSSIITAPASATDKTQQLSAENKTTAVGKKPEEDQQKNASTTTTTTQKAEVPSAAKPNETKKNDPAEDVPLIDQQNLGMQDESDDLSLQPSASPNGNQNIDGDGANNDVNFGGDYDGDDDDDVMDPINNRDNNRNAVAESNVQLPEQTKQEVPVEEEEEKEKDKIEIVNFEEEPDSYFFTYLCILMFLCILLYVLFHNKQKLLALLVEGRRGSRRNRERSRGGSKAAYSKLDCNLEEAIMSKKSLSGKSTTMDIIY